MCGCVCVLLLVCLHMFVTVAVLGVYPGVPVNSRVSTKIQQLLNTLKRPKRPPLSEFFVDDSEEIVEGETHREHMNVLIFFLLRKNGGKKLSCMKFTIPHCLLNNISQFVRWVASFRLIVGGIFFCFNITLCYVNNDSLIFLGLLIQLLK